MTKLDLQRLAQQQAHWPVRARYAVWRLVAEFRKHDYLQERFVKDCIFLSNDGWALYCSKLLEERDQLRALLGKAA